ncbi:hypothetical protein [Nitrosomonas nitrosa]|uniref:hypothetical protein n=1 Tax=Nitrosomonas nitrosa TaxID=52442 RepID=UPI0011B23241|nr:hypothetical protein [Nitrosomonas nitrosa]
MTYMTPERVVNRYDLMDSAYDVPLIDVNPRRNQALKEEITATGCVCADMVRFIWECSVFGGGFKRGLLTAKPLLAIQYESIYLVILAN